MKYGLVLVEGATEEEVVRVFLHPHFAALGLELSVTQVGRNFKLTWTKTNLSDFDSYIVLRATDAVDIYRLSVPRSPSCLSSYA